MRTITLINSSKRASLFLTALLLFPAGIAYAQPQLRIEMTAAVQEISTGSNGQQVINYQPAVSVLPGAIISYTISYQNIGNQDAIGASLVGVIPANAIYLEPLNVSSNFEIQFSSDEGENFYSPPFTFASTDADGNAITLAAGPDNYTHIRFTATTPIATDVSGNVSYLVKIN